MRFARWTIAIGSPSYAPSHRLALQVRATGLAPGFQGQVAQLVEQRIENPRVGGSIPSLATISLISRQFALLTVPMERPDRPARGRACEPCGFEEVWLLSPVFFNLAPIRFAHGADGAGRRAWLSALASLKWFRDAPPLCFPSSRVASSPP